MEISQIKHALVLSIAALEILHPIMDPEEPCVIYDAWDAANAALKSIEDYYADKQRKRSRGV